MLLFVVRVFDFSMFFNEGSVRIRHECLKDIVDFIVVIESAKLCWKY